MIAAGRAFYKMSGSGNDFVVLDTRTEPPGALADATAIRELCARGTGIGADGVVFLEPSSCATVRLAYYNADGSRADFCGNATLCTARLAVELGMAGAGSGGGDGGGDGGGELTIETDTGVGGARFAAGRAEVDLQPVTEVLQSKPDLPMQAGERRIGFARAGVPHLVILCDDVSVVDVVGRGRPLRSHPSLADGANVNFVSRGQQGQWRVRTYERGVEGETLACGSGAVATAILLTSWDEARGAVRLETRSGRELRVRLRRDGALWHPSLGGEARLVFEGRFGEIAGGR